MVYEVRSWFDNFDCLYTDDPRLKELAIRSPELRIAARYYRTTSETEPFAWDIVGEPAVLAGIAAGRRKRKPAMTLGRAGTPR
jgi:hypothetical protein